MRPRVLYRKHAEMHAHVGFVNLLERTDCPKWSLDHLHQRSVRDPALKILDEVHEYNPVDPLELFWDPEKMHSFESPGAALNSLINRVKSYLFAPWLARSFDWSKWVAISSLQRTCSPSFSFMDEFGKKLVLGFEKYFCRATCWELVEMLLSVCLSYLTPKTYRAPA
jgi:hypothetical protein